MPALFTSTSRRPGSLRIPSAAAAMLAGSATSSVTGVKRAPVPSPSPRDAGGSLTDVAMARVFDTLAGYRKALDEHDCDRNLAVLTSAVRDAANGAAFAERVREDFGLDARVLSGDEEAQLTFRGAMSGRS